VKALEIDKIANYRLSGFSVERLINFLNAAQRCGVGLDTGSSPLEE
jgi:hypothetical protein